jgi:hypothetical protein
MTHVDDDDTRLDTHWWNAVFCDIAPCSLADVDQHFKEAYCVQDVEVEIHAEIYLRN